MIRIRINEHGKGAIRESMAAFRRHEEYYDYHHDILYLPSTYTLFYCALFCSTAKCTGQ